MLKASDLKSALLNLWHMLGFLAIGLWVAVLSSDTLDRYFTGKAPPAQLTVKQLRYIDGRFHQIVQPKHRDAVFGYWSAAIREADGHALVCSGSGGWTYHPRAKPSIMTPEKWTGDSCDGMIEGRAYRAEASWLNYDAEGLEHVVRAEFEFIHEEPS